MDSMGAGNGMFMLLSRAITSPALLHFDFANSTCIAGTPGYFFRSSIISEASLRSLIIKSIIVLKSIHFDVNITKHFPYFAKVTIIHQVIN